MSSYIDLILMIFLIYSIYQGYQAGFLSSFYRVLFLVLCILLSLFLALKGKGIIYPWLIASPYIAIIILALAFATLFRYLLKKGLSSLSGFLKSLDLLWLDHILGALLGVVKAYLLIFIVISVIGSFGNRTIIKPFINSHLSMHIYKQVKTLTHFNLMQYLRELSLKKTLQDVQKNVDHTIKSIESPNS